MDPDERDTMTSPARFLRAAAAQFATLVNRTISALQVHRRSQLMAAILLSLIISIVVSHAVHTARSTQRKWTSHHTVLVTTAPIAEGEEFTNRNTQRIDLPFAVLPDNVLSEFTPGDTSRLSLQPHTAITSAMTVPAAHTVHIPDGWRVVALPDDMPAPPLQLNDSVDVVAGDSIVAAGVVVTSLDPMTIAVPAEVAASVASVVHMGEASLVASR